ncbi:hypothetical protein CL630_01265 [bacterium]|nr:hypothetical protein [bacterium]|tara:strand:+ start:2602 stop:3420 length:819 start_codon:yes stop_codon:yes gene_type:complete
MLINGKEIAQNIQEKLKQEISATKEKPELFIISIGENPVTQKFIQQKKKFGSAIGITVTEHALNEDITTEEIIKKIQSLKDKKGGIIIQLPLPDHIDKTTVLNSIPVSQDVDVLSQEAFELFKKGNSTILPPVIGAIKEILFKHNVFIGNKNIVVIGKGRLVGEPAAIWFERHQGNMQIIDSKTINPEHHILNADIILSGAGNPHFIKPDMIKNGAVLLDAGTSEQGGTLKGDIDPTCAEKASLFTPVPGGIGPITVAILFRNLLKLTHPNK